MPPAIRYVGNYVPAPGHDRVTWNEQNGNGKWGLHVVKVNPIAHKQNQSNRAGSVAEKI